MSRYIDADAFESAILKEYDKAVGVEHNTLKMVFEMLPAQPTADVQPMVQWIPCSERLPKEEKNKYWICTDTEYQCSCRWTNDNPFWNGKTSNWHWSIFDIPQYSKVVAWMSLPQPWEEVEE